MPGFLALLLKGSAADFQIVNAQSGVVVATEIVAAFDSAARRSGLLGRDGFPDGSAMVIAPTNAIHTFFMRFAIDVVFVAKDGRVLKVRPGVVPWRVAGALRAYAVIEMAAGSIEHSSVRPGDRLAVVLRPDPSR